MIFSNPRISAGFMSNYFPNQVFVYIQVIMDYSVPRPNNLAPGNLWVGSLKFC